MLDVHCEQKGQALWLTIDREERRNALNEAVFDGLRAGIAQAEASPEVRAVVITGAGEKAFCAGGDLKPNAEGDPFTVDAAERDNPAVKLFRAIIDCRVPVIARVNGHALAGGFGLVCACDFAVVADHARLGVPEARIGIFPMMILPFMLRTIPRRKLLELCVTGEPISAQEAQAAGLVNKIVPAAALGDETRALALKIAASSAYVVGIGKQAFYKQLEMPQPLAYAYAKEVMSLNATAADAQEGMGAFLEKRRPHWSNS